MDSNWAADHLQVIRTLMERSAVYRRAMAPIMIYNGALGMLGAGMGWQLGLVAPRAFIIFWTSVSFLALAGSFLLVRRQAIKDAEPFWSPPTRRVTQAMLPGLVAGGILGAIAFGQAEGAQPTIVSLGLPALPLLWVILYGCAFHAAGFFMPRGLKLFGWSFILGGCLLFAAAARAQSFPPSCAHGIMGLFFGGLHLAYGVYLYFTEPRRNSP